MASSITVPHNLMLDRILTMEIVRVTERAAVNAARLRGRGEEKAADQAAVDAMRRELNNLPIDGTVVIGEGEMDEAPMLFIGEKVGAKGGFKVDIAVDPLEGTTLCAKNMPGAIATIAIVAIDPGMFLAHSVVPSSGSTAMSTFGPVPAPTFSPMNSIGASSRSPSPITTVPAIGRLFISRRMASTAA